MGRRHSDTASFEVLGLVSYGKTSNASTSSQVGRNTGYVSGAEFHGRVQFASAR